jgi:hypothetical protein
MRRPHAGVPLRATVEGIKAAYFDFLLLAFPECYHIF